MSTLVRKTFPKIRIVKRRAGDLYQVDCRRKGTLGTQEHYGTLKEAEKRAADVAAEFNANGVEGLALSQDLRAMALRGEALLSPFGKTIWQACEFYRDHLASEQKKVASALVGNLAADWYSDKASGRTKKLRERTVLELEKAKDMLVSAFGDRRILDVTKTDVETYIHGQKVGLQRKYNLNSLFSQFFNWCIARKLTDKNPASEIEIEVGNKDVEIFSPEGAESLLNVCEAQFPAFTLYHAICLYAGLRPEEAQFLQWEQVHLDEREIHVLAETSKINESRNVHIEDNLYAWLIALKPKNAKGYVSPQKNFTNYCLQIHIAAGFRGTLTKKVKGQRVKTIYNEDKPTWHQDICRHSYGSYWLAKNGNRAQLAENMGNSLKIIKKHYRKVVSKSATARYWSFFPKAAVEAANSEKAALLSKL